MTQTIGIGDLRLRAGGLLRDARIAYTSYGRLDADGRNALLVTHGFTSSHRFIEAGGWGSLLGPGRPLDTDRFFVVSSNMLGSSYGSTSPASINQETGRRYGPDFPSIVLADIVAAQRLLLERLGVKQLVAVVGPSYGGLQAFTWGVEFPDFLRGLVAVETALHTPALFDDADLLRRLSHEPQWNGGYYADASAVLDTMMELRVATLRRYGIEEELSARLDDALEVQAEIERQARAWALEFDAHSLLSLGRALNRYDLRAAIDRIKAPTLYVLSRTDKIFPPSLAQTVMPALAAAGVAASYFEIDSRHGHLGSDLDVAQWAPVLKAFLDGLTVR